MQLAKILCDRLYELGREALRAEDFESSMVYSTAEDLADGLLKGTDYGEALPRLLRAYEVNGARADSEAERSAWARAATEAKALGDSQ